MKSTRHATNQCAGSRYYFHELIVFFILPCVNAVPVLRQARITQNLHPETPLLEAASSLRYSGDSMSSELNAQQGPLQESRIPTYVGPLSMLGDSPAHQMSYIAKSSRYSIDEAHSET